MTRQEYENLDWTKISKKLTLFSKKRLGEKYNIQEAENVAQDSVRILLDPKYNKQEVTDEKSVILCLGSIANGIISNIKKKKANKYQTLTDFSNEKDLNQINRKTFEEYAGIFSEPEKSITANEIIKRLDKKISSLGSSDIENIYMLISDGIIDADMQAKELKLTIAQTYKLRFKINNIFEETFEEYQKESKAIERTNV